MIAVGTFSSEMVIVITSVLNAYVSGAVILACLNADNTAMTIYVTGTNVASDSARLGGELPSYYATDIDMGNAQTDITNIQNIIGNNSIVGIGDGTLTGAVSSLNNNLMVLNDIPLAAEAEALTSAKTYDVIKSGFIYAFSNRTVYDSSLSIQYVRNGVSGASFALHPQLAVAYPVQKGDQVIITGSSSYAVFVYPCGCIE